MIFTTNMRSENLLCAVAFIDLLGVGLFFPLLYPRLRELGASHVIVGIFGSTYSGLQVISGPLVGSWSDTRGRKFVAIVTVLLSSFCYFLIGCSSSIGSILVLRIILGVFKHTQVLCRANVGDFVPKSRHAEVYGRTAAISSMGFVIGPVIGGYLSEVPNGFFYVCNLVSFLFIINAVIFSIIPNKPQVRQARNRPFLKAIGSELRKSVNDLLDIDWSVYWDSLSLRFLFGLSISIYFSQQSLFIKEKYNLSQKYVGYSISLLTIIGSLSAFSLGFVNQTFYKKDTHFLQILFHSFILLTVSFLGLYLTSSVAFFILLIVPLGLSSSVLRILTQELMLNKSTGDKRGSLSGVSTSIMSVSRFVSPIMSGIVGDLFGENAILLSAILPTSLATFLCYKLRKNVVKVSKKDS